MSTTPIPAQGWKPSDEQLNFEIIPAWETIRAELEELQQSLGCPDAYIDGMLDAIAVSYRSTGGQP